MTRSRKRDCSQFFVNIAFLVWIVSATSVEYNGASYVTGFGKTLRMGSARDSRNARF